MRDVIYFGHGLSGAIDEIFGPSGKGNEKYTVSMDQRRRGSAQ